MDRRNLLKAGLASLGVFVVTPEVQSEEPRPKLRKVSTEECIEKGGCRPFKQTYIGKKEEWNPGVECLFCGSQHPGSERNGPCFNCGVYW